MSSYEFAEWLAYARIQPFGETHADYRAGTIAAIIANVYQKKGSKKLSWRDFFPAFERRAPADPNAIVAAVARLNAALGGIDKRETPAE